MKAENTPGEYWATIDPKFLLKVDRVFDASSTTVFQELLQNSRRAGATAVRISIAKAHEGVRVTFSDNGTGLKSPESLLKLAGSDWASDEAQQEDPAGMGFFVMSNFPRTRVWTADWSGTFTPAVFRGEEPLQEVGAIKFDEYSPYNMNIEWLWKEGAKPVHITEAARAATQFCGIDSVTLIGHDGETEVIGRNDFVDSKSPDYSSFLEESGYAIQVVKQGFGSDFPKVEVNFYGVRVTLKQRDWKVSNESLDFLSTLGRTPLSIKVDVQRAASETGLKLVLPARNALKQDAGLGKLLDRIEYAVFAWFARHEKGSHDLRFASYQRAKSLGVDIGEASQSRTLAHTGFKPGRTLLRPPDTGFVRSVLFRDFERAFPAYAVIHHDTDLVGYQWYDNLPSISAPTFVVGGEPVPDKVVSQGTAAYCEKASERPPDPEYLSLVDSIEVKYQITTPAPNNDEVGTVETLIDHRAALVYGRITFGAWEDADSEGGYVQVARGAVDDPEALEAVAEVIERKVFPSPAEGLEDYGPALALFKVNMWRDLLELVGRPKAGALQQLKSVIPHIPDGSTTGELVWSIRYDGRESAVGDHTGFVATIQTTEEEADNHKLVGVLVMGDQAVIVDELTSDREITRGRAEDYLKARYGYDGKTDGMILLPAKTIPVNLDEWENEKDIS